MADQTLSAQRLSMIETHLARYPQAEIQDIYKLLYQSIFGPGHLLSNKKAAAEVLEVEMEHQVPDAHEALLESVHPAHAVVRLHLRPYLAHEGQLNWLMNAWDRSAKQLAGDEAPMAALMAAFWADFLALLEPGGLFEDRFDRREARLFGTMRGRERWPAVHHSPAFNQVYHPAYRVLTQQEAADLCQRLKVPYEVI